MFYRKIDYFLVLKDYRQTIKNHLIYTQLEEDYEVQINSIRFRCNIKKLKK